MQKNNISATQPNDEQENVRQSENLTSSAPSVQPAESVRESALQRLQAAIAQGNNAGERVDISKEKSPDQGDPSTSESDADFWRRFVPSDIFNPKRSTPLIEVGGQPIVLRGEVTGIKGKVNQGKSQLWGVLTAAVLGDGEPIGSMKAAAKDLRLLIIDTEQSDESACERVGRGIVTATGKRETPERIKLLILAGESEETIKKALETAIAAHRPDIIVIDGIAQLFPNFNDPAEAGRGKNYVRALTKGSNRPSVVWVLHENKSKEDKNAKGHLGSLLVENADVVLSVERAGDDNNPTFVSSTAKSRHRWADNYAFGIDNNRGVYVATGSPVQKSGDLRKQAKLNEEFDAVQRCMDNLIQQGDLTLKGNIIREMIRQQVAKERTAERWVAELEEEKYIKAQLNGCYFTTPRGERETGISKEN